LKSGKFDTALYFYNNHLRIYLTPLDDFIFFLTDPTAKKIPYNRERIGFIVGDTNEDYASFTG
jgi:hypothetical protein